MFAIRSVGGFVLTVTPLKIGRQLTGGIRVDTAQDVATARKFESIGRSRLLH